MKKRFLPLVLFAGTAFGQVVNPGGGGGGGGSTCATTSNLLAGNGVAAGCVDSGIAPAAVGLIANPLSQFAATTSAQLAGTISDETGTGLLVFGTAPTITLLNATGLPISTGVSGLGTGVSTFLATPTSTNLASALTDETGSGPAVFSVSPALTGTPTVPTAASGTNTTQAASTAFVTAALSAVPSTYTGLVATRGEIAYATTGGNTWEMVRSFHIARSAIAANTMKLVWSNYYVPTSNVETGAGAATYKASVEYPVVFVTGTASSSSTSITVASNAGIVNGMSVTCGTTAASCSTLASNTLVTNVSGTTITISPATTGSLSTTPIMFSSFTQCTFGGSGTSASIAALADVTSDTCGPAIPNGRAFYVRAVRNGASAVIYATDPNNNHYSGTQEGIMFGTGTPTDLTAGGTVTTISGQYNYPPSAIIAPTINPAVCILGDSRAYGGNDVVSDATNDVGEVVRFIGPAFAYIKLTPSGTTAGQVPTNFTNRQRLIPYCSHAVDEYGINDAGAAIGAATIASSHSTIATMLGIPTFGTTLPTTTTSTDSWLTTTNQTGSGNASIVVTYNALARAGILGEVGVLDIANIVDPYALGVWPVSKIPFATSGTANFGTSDGLHESPLMLQIEAQGLGYTTNWFKR